MGNLETKTYYRIDFLPHPWNEKLRVDGMKAWCLVRCTEPEFGVRRAEPVAIFNLDSEAETFMGFCYSLGEPVEIDDQVRQLFQSKRHP